jgi:predicted cobalt transporter CbtA
MSIGSTTLLAIAAAALATLLWWIATRLNAAGWVCMFLFGVALALVVLAGPLIRLP